MQTQNVWWLSYAFLEDVYKLMLRALHGIAVEEADAEVHTLTHPTQTHTYIAIMKPALCQCVHIDVGFFDGLLAGQRPSWLSERGG